MGVSKETRQRYRDFREQQQAELLAVADKIKEAFGIHPVATNHHITYHIGDYLIVQVFPFNDKFYCSVDVGGAKLGDTNDSCPVVAFRAAMTKVKDKLARITLDVNEVIKNGN